MQEAAEEEERARFREQAGAERRGQYEAQLPRDHIMVDPREIQFTQTHTDILCCRWQEEPPVHIVCGM